MTIKSIISLIALSAEACHAEGTAPEYLKSNFPLIEKHCIACHNEKTQKGEISFSIFRDDASMMKGRKTWEKAAELVASGEMPPKKKPRPAQAEINTFTHAVASFFDKADRSLAPDPGRVAMRRLNRAEYNNTVRDLLFIDFNAAEDFPADEVGHGFDNISDVQWLSAVLMERYIAAAESVTNRAIATAPIPAPVRQQDGKFLEPAGKDVPQGKFRPIANEKPDDPIFTGPLHNPYKVNANDAYIFKVKLYAKPEPKQRVEIAILACGPNVPKPSSDAEAAELFGAAVKNLRPFQIMNRVEVFAREEKDANVLSVRLPENLGMQRMAVAIVKPPEGQPVPKVFVEWFKLEGPLDTRPLFHRKNMTIPSGKFTIEQTRELLRNFLPKAFRRPATEEEFLRYVKIADDAQDRGEKWEVAIQLAIQAILLSPKFLFRPELEHRAPQPGMHAIGEFELASRLSYFLWSSMPDDELFALAAKYELSKNIEPQVRRMLADPKSRALVDNFAMQWLQLRRLESFAPDPKIFPRVSSRLKPSMLQETTLFIDAIIREDRSILDLIDSNFTFLNEPLARHYGIADTNGNKANQKAVKPEGKQFRGDQFHRVELIGNERGGLLTQASILAVTSNPTRTSPVKRGKWVLEQLLGTPPPPPPPDVPDFENNSVLTGSLRQRLEQHRANASCANCHAKMDPIGFALENYDAIGAYRSKDGELSIDASGTLPDGRSFKDFAELKSILKEKKDLFSRCLAEKLLIYALGRGLEGYDKRSVDSILEKMSADNYKFSTLAIEIAKSEPFRMRRGEEKHEIRNPKSETNSNFEKANVQNN